MSLWFGRNEECGLRCPYHGWKYDVHRPVHRGAVRAERERLLPEDQAEVLSAGRARRRAVDLYGPARASSRRCRSGNSPWCRPSRRFISKRLQECNWLQAMEGGIDSSHVSFLHSRRAQHRSAVQGRQGQPVQPGRHAAGVRGGREPPAASSSARAATPRTATTTGASRQWVMPCLHHDPAARRPSGARPLLGADRRRELLGLELRLPSDARADRDASVKAMRGRQGHPRASTSRAPTGRSPTRTTTT